MDERQKIVNSALWSAYGDALGFVNEFAKSLNTFQRRQLDELRTAEWRRRIGGRTGPVITLPAGCYSDDTQLRLATSRAIRADGEFDAEAFSKIELTIWPTYEIGGGRGTKAAAASLRRQNARWNNNFFVKEQVYVKGGGNGAAMRIQPHVWCAPDVGVIDAYLLDVVRNAVCTHGHPQAILGALYHAESLAHVIAYEEIPGPDKWMRHIQNLRDVPTRVRADEELGRYWLPLWERESRQSFERAWGECLEESLSDAKQLEELARVGGSGYAGAAARTLGCTEAKFRGAGMKTALLATAITWINDRDLKNALRTAAGLVGTDTDTIATMIGALIGAIVDERMPGKLMDTDYIEKSAHRLYQIKRRAEKMSFNYPDLLTWIPPKTALDVVRLQNGECHVVGLGRGRVSGPEVGSPSESKMCWQWIELEVGQSLLAKRRLDFEPAKARSIEKTPTNNAESEEESEDRRQLREAVDEVVKSRFEAGLFGRSFMRIAHALGSEAALQFASEIAGQIKKVRK